MPGSWNEGGATDGGSDWLETSGSTQTLASGDSDDCEERVESMEDEVAVGVASLVGDENLVEADSRGEAAVVVGVATASRTCTQQEMRA